MHEKQQAELADSWSSGECRLFHLVPGFHDFVFHTFNNQRERYKKNTGCQQSRHKTKCAALLWFKQNKTFTFTCKCLCNLTNAGPCWFVRLYWWCSTVTNRQCSMDFSSLKAKINISIKNKTFIILKLGFIKVLFRDLSPSFFSFLSGGTKLYNNVSFLKTLRQYNEALILYFHSRTLEPFRSFRQ